MWSAEKTVWSGVACLCPSHLGHPCPSISGLSGDKHRGCRQVGQDTSRSELQQLLSSCASIWERHCWRGHSLATGGIIRAASWPSNYWFCTQKKWRTVRRKKKKEYLPSSGLFRQVTYGGVTHVLGGCTALPFWNWRSQLLRDNYLQIQIYEIPCPANKTRREI